ncbi:uncharacterized protein FIBRA_01953 [Fibroporia radiculosa]|uniref:Isochorismatase-like domain-containing protein n=1 Tax=Fibroporia radiculosa TaxID=599839 RepID=J4G198_9APHY|nr:uncharacterized protein FIBRA_01953 [Fibroporia radiculosa]CCL99928.1 predicted protein [Fibroporia radiculosa]
MSSDLAWASTARRLSQCQSPALLSSPLPVKSKATLPAHPPHRSPLINPAAMLGSGYSTKLDGPSSSESAPSPPQIIHSCPQTNGLPPSQVNGHSHSHTSCVLLLLDVQVAPLSDPPIGVPSARIVGPNIAKILAAARACPPRTRPRIVHVRNAGAPGEADEPRAPGWALVHTPLPHEPVVDKRKNNAFSGTALAELVPPDAILVVVGLQSDFCVRATCSTALARGNEVLLIRGAHATYDRVEPWGIVTSTPADRVACEIEEELEEAGVVILEMEDVPNLFGDR